MGYALIVKKQQNAFYALPVQKLVQFDHKIKMETK